MSLPPVHARPKPPADAASVQARPGHEDASARSGKPFDSFLSEAGGPQMPLSSQAGDARQGQDAGAPTVAEMFNEHGFFANAAELHPRTEGEHAAQRSGGMSVESISAQPAPAPVLIAPQAPYAGGDTNAVPGSAASPVGASAAARPPGFGGPLAAQSTARFAGPTTGSPTTLGVTTRHAPQIFPTAARASAADAQRPAADQDLASSRADKRLAAAIEKHLRRTSAGTVRVEVRAAEDGLLVTARTDKLDRAERSRLRTEIAALLSRHGRVPARISLNGDSAPIRQV